jgi:nucleotide-binding universal stress UspA family protein
VLDAEASVTDVDRGLIDAVLFESGRPLVVVPPGQNSFAAGRVLVAWDGSAHAAAALGNALPLLKAADAVEIASVSEEKNWSCLVPGADAARYLARHGVSPTVTSLPIQNRDIAETLRSHATRSGADLMVMGAYKHSRLREWIMGGVTHGLLSECPIPLYMVR